ncbi:MAG TPA: HAD family hydrolase [Nevskiaceae bacterium]|nr:HAD family hydrolase [Nevskiaceae bacterium]
MTAPNPKYVVSSAGAELAVFDLDETLLNGDSDYLWGVFLADSGYVDRSRYEATNRRFYEDYLAGSLDIHAFCRFSLAPLVALDPQTRESLRRRFVEQCIKPVVAPRGPALLAEHHAQGHTTLITTSTNRFVTTPIAALLGVDVLLATEPEIVGDRYTGEVIDPPNFRDGKITRLQAWIAAQPHEFTKIYAYSDSHNDLPLLEFSDAPTAVDPDPRLRNIAQQRGWPVISLR